MKYVFVGAAVRHAFGVEFRGRIDGILRTVGAKADQGNGGALEVVGSVEAGVLRDHPSVFRDARIFPVGCDILQRRGGNTTDGRGNGRLQLRDVKIPAKHDSDHGHAVYDGGIRARRRIVFHQVRHQLEELDTVQAVHLIPDRRAHVNIRIHHAVGRRIGFAVRAERHQGELVLKGVHLFVVLRRSGAVSAAQDPHQAGRRLILRNAGREGAFPARPRDRVFLRPGSGGTLAGHLKNIRPGVEHRHEVVAALAVWNA